VDKARNPPAGGRQYCAIPDARTVADNMNQLIGALICYQNVPQLCVLCALCGVKRHTFITFFNIKLLAPMLQQHQPDFGF